MGGVKIQNHFYDINQKNFNTTDDTFCGMQKEMFSFEGKFR